LDKFKISDADSLFNTILNMESLEECYHFFKDLLTISELQSLTQRWEVAKMLDEGITYNAISEKTGASTATISRVNRSLVYGEGGYQQALSKANKKK
jgi:TrpR-related protein YerC/YecD